MGYTHYWKFHGWSTPQNRDTWAQLISDTRLIVEATDVRLCGSFPDECGDEDCEPPLVSVKNGIAINGVDGDEHELFELSIDDNSFIFCKTARKPYDVVVCCVLLRAYVLAPQCIDVSSDGDCNEDEWSEARDLYAQLWDKDTIQRPPENVGD